MGLWVKSGMCGLLLCAAWVALRPSPAHAYHTREHHVITDNAYTLPAHSAQIGLARFDFSRTPWVTASTYHFAWLLGFANLHLKARLYHDDQWTWAAKAGAFRLDLARLGKLGADTKAVLWIVPAELAVSRAFGERYDLSFTVPYTKVALTGQYDPTDFRGVLAVSNLQVTSTFEWRVTRLWALLLHARALIFQELSGSIESELALDAYTRAEIHAEARSNELSMRRAGSLTLSNVLSYEVVNFRFGVGYGHWSLPAINFVTPKPQTFVELDLYFRL